MGRCAYLFLFSELCDVWVFFVFVLCLVNPMLPVCFYVLSRLFSLTFIHVDAITVCYHYSCTNVCYFKKYILLFLLSSILIVFIYSIMNFIPPDKCSLVSMNDCQVKKQYQKSHQKNS